MHRTYVFPPLKRRPKTKVERNSLPSSPKPKTSLKPQDSVNTAFQADGSLKFVTEKELNTSSQSLQAEQKKSPAENSSVNLIPNVEENNKGKYESDKEVKECLVTIDVNENKVSIPTTIAKMNESQQFKKNETKSASRVVAQKRKTNFLKKIWRRNMFNKTWRDIAASTCGTIHKVVNCFNREGLLELLAPLPTQLVILEFGQVTGVIANLLKKECEICKSGLNLLLPISFPCEHFSQKQCHHIYIKDNEVAKLRCPVKDCGFVVSEKTLKTFKNLKN